MENKDLEKMFNVKKFNPSCKNCYFNQEGICKFNNELIKESNECDYFQDKDFVFEQIYKVALDQPKIKRMLESEDFQKRIDDFFKSNQELIGDKNFEEHLRKIKENYEEAFDGVNIFGRAKEEMIEMLKEFALPLIVVRIDDEGKIHYVDYNVYVDFCQKTGLKPIVTEEKFYIIRRMYKNE